MQTKRGDEMNKLKGLTFAAMIALSLVASTTDAFAKDVKNGRETAWTDLVDLPTQVDLPAPLDAANILTDGVTWEE
jgi:hypothetical protein